MALCRPCPGTFPTPMSLGTAAPSWARGQQPTALVTRKAAFCRGPTENRPWRAGVAPRPPTSGGGLVASPGRVGRVHPGEKTRCSRPVAAARGGPHEVKAFPGIRGPSLAWGPLAVGPHVCPDERTDWRPGLFFLLPAVVCRLLGPPQPGSFQPPPTLLAGGRGAVSAHGLGQPA